MIRAIGSRYGRGVVFGNLSKLCTFYRENSYEMEGMETDLEFLKLFSVDGVWALLSVALIFYILKNQERRDERQDLREQNYQQVILDLTESTKDVLEIKQLLQRHLPEKQENP